MAAIVVKVYRYPPAAASDGTLTTLLTAELAADSVTSGDVLSFDTEMIRGEIVVTVLHT